MQWIGDGAIAECMKGGLQGVICACMLVAKSFLNVYERKELVTNTSGAPRALYLSLIDKSSNTNGVILPREES